MTISALFKTLHEDLGKIEWVNRGCDALIVHFSVDSARGYPRQIDYQLERVSPSNIGWLNYAGAKPLGSLDIPFCTMLYFSKGGYKVTLLEPLF